MKLTGSGRPAPWWSGDDVAAALKEIKDLLEQGIDDDNFATVGTDTIDETKFEKRFGVCAAAVCAETVTRTGEYYASAGIPTGRDGWLRGVSSWMRTTNPGGDLILDSQKATSPTTLINGAAVTGDDDLVYNALVPDDDPVDATDEPSVQPTLAGAEDYDVVGVVLWLAMLHAE